jgi:hypothetical protein
MTMDAPIIEKAERCQQAILDADYKATNVAECTKNLKHLNTEQQDKLYRLLNEYPGLFKGGLGTLNVPHVHLDILPLENTKIVSCMGVPDTKML